MTEIKDILEFEREKIIVDRIRYFWKFETPSLVKCVEEITFYYNKGDNISRVEWVLDDIRPFLHIYDSTGEQLEFYGNSDEKDKSLHAIYIDFPEKRPLISGEHRTIRLDYARIVQDKLRNATITIPLPENVTTYTYIQISKNYELKAEYGIQDNELSNRNFYVDKGISFFHIYTSAAESINTLIISVEHKIPKSLSDWYNMGLLFGGTYALFIWPFYHYNPTGITYYATFGAIIISLLIIIKGWLFSKDMDRHLEKYDASYQLLLITIFSEIVGMMMHFSIIL